MIDPFDASHDGLRLAVARALSRYDEPALLACLADADPILRTAAARQLHTRGTRSTFDHAASLLTHPRFEQREIGAFVLGQLGTPKCPFAAETLASIPRLLDDPYVEVQAAAAGAVGSLASLGHQPPVHVTLRLASLARDGDADLRASVAFALGMIDDPISRAALVDMEDDADPEVRDMAATAAEWQDDRRAVRSAPTQRAAS